MRNYSRVKRGFGPEYQVGLRRVERVDWAVIIIGRGEASILRASGQAEH